MEIKADKVKDLREKTGVGMMECKTALVECQGDFEKAIVFLRERGLMSAAKRAGRVAGEGTVAAYIHAGGQIGVLLELNCETDFVAKTDEFQALARELAMQVAAANPLFVKKEDVPAEIIQRERGIYETQMGDSKKPPEIREKILAGKLQKYFEEVCLLEQAYIKDPAKKAGQLVTEAVSKTGENIQVRRFARYKIGEE
jgi:elongation factor Ts